MSAARPRLLTALGVLLMASGLVLGVFALPSDAGTEEDPDAARAVRALLSGDAEDARAAMPADFASRLGYRPVLREGLLVRPDGSCSSPLPLPDRFEPVCARHDLGYDLLRYAAAHHRPLGAWARVRVDHALSAGLHRTCGSPEGEVCRVAATTAYLAVRANSVRQGDGVPGPETPATIPAAGRRPKHPVTARTRSPRASTPPSSRGARAPGRRPGRARGSRASPCARRRPGS